MKHESTYDNLNAILTLSEAADFLGISRPTMSKLIASGKIKGFRPSARSWRITKQSLMEFIENACDEERIKSEQRSKVVVMNPPSKKTLKALNEQKVLKKPTKRKEETNGKSITRSAKIK